MTSVNTQKMPVKSGDLTGVLLRKLVSNKKITKEDLDDILSITSQKVIEAVQAEALTFYILDGAELVFQHVHYAKHLIADNAERYASLKHKLTGMRMPREQGIVGKVVREKEPVVVLDVAEGGIYKPPAAKDTGFEVRSMMTMPLKVGGDVVGALQALNKHPDFNEGYFADEDVEKLLEVADYSAKIIQKAVKPDTEFSPVEMADYICRLSRKDRFDAAKEPVDDKLGLSAPEDLLRKNTIYPVNRVGADAVTLLMVNPLDLLQKDEFQAATGLQVKRVLVATRGEITALIDRAHPPVDEASAGSGTAPKVTTMDEVLAKVDVQYSESESGASGPYLDIEDEGENSAPIIQLCNRIIEDAYVSGASDIHIEPFEKEVTVRYRVDGLCIVKLRLPKAVSNSLISRYKIMSELDISERRMPQDGRIVFKKYSRAKMDIDLRVATAPMNHGEKIVMRILDKSKSTLPLEKLGFSKSNLEIYRRLIRMPYGMILHCGPTGSGKSMTLYSALGEVATPDVNIQTAEDPIEYTLAGINQMQVRKDIGLTFAAALRSYLRQDPDIILVGEIRDKETAEIAIEASLTGHMLFSTLHTNDAAGTVSRFVDMGIEPFMIASSLVCVCAQRLLRRVCSECREPYVASDDEKILFEKAQVPFTQLYRARKGGCPKCGGNSYKGRTGTHEILSMNDELKDIINKHGTTEEIKACLMKNGMRTLYQDTLEKVAAGVTTLEEALTVVKPDTA